MKALRSLISRPQNSLLVFLVCLMVVLTVVFFLAMFVEEVETYLYEFVGVSKGAKFILLQSLGVSIGGVFIACQALASYMRAIAMDKAATAQADSTSLQATANLYIEQGQRQERLRTAIDHLGHSSSSVRLGGVYELVHLARETDALRQTVFGCFMRSYSANYHYG